jgi:hypothetical protein
VTFWQDCKEAQEHAEFPDDFCSIDTGLEKHTMKVSIRITFQAYDFYREITLTTYNFMEGHNHGYKFCLIFRSRIWQVNLSP